MSARPLLCAISLLSLATACTTTPPEPANAPGGGKPAAEPGAPAERLPAAAPEGQSNAHPPAGGEAAHTRQHGHGPSGNGNAHEGPHGDQPSEHEKHHAHGSAGYDMDFSSTDRFAAHFDDPARDAWQKPGEVVRLLDVKPGQTVVDLGAGTGYFEAVLSEAVGESGRVIALDTEPNMVEHLQERARTSGWKNVDPRVVPPDDPKLGPDSVDRVLIVNTWHHISDRKAYASKVAEGLREGGAVLVVDYTLDADRGPPKKHRLTPEQVVHELRAGGLQATIVQESLPKQYAVRGTVE